jgi:hypothetical protein
VGSLLSFFPTPQPDELIISICARYADLRGEVNPKSIFQDIFKKSTITAVVDLPGNLLAMINSLPQGHQFSVDQLIDQHTLFPFYCFTLTQMQKKRLREGMKKDGKSLHIAAGIVANSVPKLRSARFCGQCVIEDIASIGEPYWHRAHQIPGVEVCPKHSCWLERSNYQYRDSNQRYQLISARQAIPQSRKAQQVDTNNKENQIHLYLARESYWLLNNIKLPIPRKELRERYTTLLIKKNLATYTGRIRTQKVHNKFLNFYPKKFLKQLNLEERPVVNIYWLERFFHARHNAISPIQHLLVLYFLGETLESLVKVPYQKTPFGPGPWPCLNKVCKEYHSFSIKTVQIEHKEAKPVGFFRCTACGFTYNRRGPDLSPQDLFRRNHIITPGKIWQKRLRLLAKDSSISLREKSRQLGVAIRTVKKHEYALMAKKMKIRKIVNSVKRKSQRDAWKKLRNVNPTLSMKYLRTKEKALYAWLYRNDPVWLRKNQPAKKKMKISATPRVDWKLRDRITASKITKAAKEIIGHKGKPTAVSVKAISQALGLSSWFEKKLDKMPLCRKALMKVTEDRVAYGLRRLIWAKQYCRKNQIPPNRSTLIRLAGIDRIKDLPQIRRVLE